MGSNYNGLNINDHSKTVVGSYMISYRKLVGSAGDWVKVYTFERGQIHIILSVRLTHEHGRCMRLKMLKA